MRYRKEMKEIKIEKEFRIPRTDIILEKGDRIQIKEASNIALDIMLDKGETPASVGNAFAKKYGVTFKGYQASNSANGYPVLFFSGDDRSLGKLTKKEMDDDLEVFIVDKIPPSLKK